MRSMAQKRLTAVGRVRASVSQISSNWVRRLGLLHAERDTHGSRYADSGRAADHHGTDRLSDLFVIRASDVALFARETSLVDHHHAGLGPLNGLDHAVLFCARNAANCVRL